MAQLKRLHVALSARVKKGASARVEKGANLRALIQPGEQRIPRRHIITPALRHRISSYPSSTAHIIPVTF